MILERQQAYLRQRHDAIRVQLVATELDLGITFCRVAETTHDPERYDRNILNARLAYAAAAYFLGHNHLKTAIDSQVNEKFVQLTSLLARNGCA